MESQPPRRSAGSGSPPRRIPRTPEEFFTGDPIGLATYRWCVDTLRACEPVSVRISKSQVSFRAARGFAYLWQPGQWMRGAQAPVVLSIALPRRLESGRFKEVAHPAVSTWMHHLEVRTPRELDDEVAQWLRSAHAAARG